jgi:chemotaxis regulatin CheY-phosphate phosphatase CheZ
MLLGLAHSRGLAAGCFLATMPQYALETPNPKASKALVGVFQRILNTSVDMTELDERIREADGFMGEFEERVAAAIQQLKQEAERRLQGGEEAEEGGSEDRPEPYQLMQHIEELFDKAQRDRSQTGLLKEELDRWGLFKLYEDRFLDLFDKTRNGK